MRLYHQAFIILLLVGTFSCNKSEKTQETNATEQAIQHSIKEINSLIQAENWEKARMVAETTSDAYSQNMSAIESAQMVLIYIQLLAEPQLNTNFEKYYLYAKRIIQFNDLAMTSDGELTKNYYISKGVENIIQETYENAQYIVTAKDKAGEDSTYIQIKSAH